jgi:WD40 repeat protein
MDVFDRSLLSKFKSWEVVESRPVDSFFISADGKCLAGVWDNYQKPYSEPVHSDLLYETDGARAVMRLEPEGLIYAFYFSKDSNHITTLVNDGTVRIWNLTSRREVCRIVGDGIIQAVALSPNGEYVTTSSDRGTIQTWLAAGGQHRAQIPGDWREISFGPDGKQLITLKELEYRIWGFPAGNEIFKKSHDGLNFVLSPNQRYFATDYQNYKTDGESIHVLETSTGSELGSFRDPTNEKRGQFPWAHALMQKAVSPDGQLVVAEGMYTPQQPRPDDLPILVWSTAHGNVALRLPHPGYGRAVAFSPDGHYLATGGTTVRLWELPGGRQVSELVPRQKVTEVVFSPTGKYLVTASEDTSPQVWEVATGNEAEQLENSDSRLPVIFTADERYLATATVRNFLRVAQN